MRGIIKQRGNSLTVWIELPRVNGKRKREVFTIRGTDSKARKVAESRMKRRIIEIEDGILATGSHTTVSQFLDRWLEKKRTQAANPQDKMSASTVERYGQIVERFIKPQLGGIKIAKLQPVQIEAAIAIWQASSVAKNEEQKLSQRTVHHIFSTLRASLNQAKRWNVITRNPCDNVEAVSKPRSRVAAIDEVAALRLVTLLEGSPLKYPTLVAVLTGLRRGELLAVRWSDLNIEKRSLRVQRSLELVGSRLQFKAPKTIKGVRTVALPQQAIAALKSHRAAQSETRLRLGARYHDEDLIFPRFDGHPWHPKRFSSAFHRKMKSLKVDVSFHGLRHSYASILLRAGVSLKVASEALGHEHISTTADIYMEVLGELQQGAADELTSIFERASAASIT